MTAAECPDELEPPEPSGVYDQDAWCPHCNDKLPTPDGNPCVLCRATGGAT